MIQKKSLIKIAVCLILLPFTGIAQDRTADSLEYKNLIDQVNKKIELLNSKSSGATSKAEISVQDAQWQFALIQTEYLNTVTQFYKNHLNSYIGLKAFDNAMLVSKNKGEMIKDFSKFSKELQSTDLGQSILHKLTSNFITQEAKVLKEIEVGQLALNFTQNDVNGKPVKLSDFKGKYVLVDFWASWCKPCRAENPHVVKVFEAYKDKGFTILGISLDNSREKWMEAIEKDGLRWTHVSDLKGWNNSVAKNYGVVSVPQNYLIDPTGKIVAKNLRGDALYKKVGELLGKGNY